jgi:hypothetical protein
MKCRLYYDATDPSTTWKDVEPDWGLEAILARLKEFKRTKNLEVFDTSTLTREERSKAYIQAVVPSVLKKYRIRKIFGSQRHSGSAFGLGVPALLVYEDDSETPTDVYPHENLGRIVTISEFLTGQPLRATEASRKG